MKQVHARNMCLLHANTHVHACTNSAVRNMLGEILAAIFNQRIWFSFMNYVLNVSRVLFTVSVSVTRCTKFQGS
jgi:hypothetical protein